MQAGDEVALDDGILVELGEVVSTTETDLAPLFERERKRPENDTGLSDAARLLVGGKVKIKDTTKKHRSLNALLGTPKGSYGRAQLPVQSPFDQRNVNNENEWDSGPNKKRRKVEVQPWAVTRITKGGTSTPVKETPLWPRTAGSRRQVNAMATSTVRTIKPSPKQNGLSIKEVIDITSDNENVPFSDVTIPTTPSVSKACGRSTDATSCNRKRIAPTRLVSPPVAPARLTSLPVSTKNRVKNVDVDTVVPDDTTSRTPTEAPQAKPLRLAKSQQRPMLLCHKASVPPVEPKKPRKRRPDPYEGLHDLEDDNISSKKLAKPIDKTERRGNAKTQAKSTNLKISTNKRTLLNSDSDRYSSLVFSILPPRAERFEKPAPPQMDAETVLPDQPNQLSTQKDEAWRLRNQVQDKDVTQGQMDHETLATTVVRKNNSKERNKSKGPVVDHQDLAQTRPFRRVQSENDAVVPNQEDSAIATLPAIDEAKGPADANTKEKKARSSRRKQPIRRAISEGAGADKQSNVSELKRTRSKGRQPDISTLSKQDSMVEERKETGAWTVEATDLFDWRPPNWDLRMKAAEMQEA